MNSEWKRRLPQTGTWTNADGSESYVSPRDVRERLLRMATLSVDEAAFCLSMSRNQAYKAVREGDIPSQRFGRSIRVLTAPLRRMLGLDEWIEQPEVAPPSPPPVAATPQQRDYKTMMMRTNREGWRAASRLSIQLDRPLEDLLVEAANDLLRKYGQSPVIEKRSPPKRTQGQRA
jgi:excisionase family DNA binding protein